MYAMCIILFLNYLLIKESLGAITEGSRISSLYSPYNERRYLGYCPENSKCVPINSCPIYQNIINHECLQANRLGSLSCGYEGTGLICCPKISNSQAPTLQTYRGCGISPVQKSNYGGIGAYPWVARVGFKNVQTGETKYPCGASIITNQVILTAAHCALAKSDNFKLSNVKVGEYKEDSDLDCGKEFCALPAQDIGISHVIVHPGYQKESYKDDIALIILRAPINFTVTAQPICLPDSWSTIKTDGILVGWGKISGQTETPSVQQSIRLPLTGLQQCINLYGTTVPITEYHLCVGGQRERDACSGFGGSPLIQQQGNVFYQIGILSFGSDRCGAPGIPSVYINVKKYVNWINENVPQIYNNY